jgi:hypothetical protein
MIYLNLKGGLCNMLFQIATATSIAISKNTTASFPNLDDQLKMLNEDIKHNPNLKHSFEYKNLNIFKNLITEKPKESCKRIDFPFHYSKINLDDSDYIIDGFFQSENYFKENEDYIRNMFSATNEINELINTKYGEIIKYRTTSVHFRRGDYLLNPSIHPTQTMEYYNESIRITKDITEKYLIFSDDISWCKENFKSDDFIFIENEKDYIELYLMSKCDNNIIANSSFSWWGAWLNNNPNKVVIGPTKWFGPSFSFFNTNDVLPKNWIKI